MWTIDPNTLPENTIVECMGGFHPVGALCCHIARVFVPVPEGMLYADAEAALADAGAWVEMPEKDIPFNARVREEYRGWQDEVGPSRFFCHRDDLPPTDPDAELVEKMARASHDVTYDGSISLAQRPAPVQDMYRARARAALAVVREHEARS